MLGRIDGSMCLHAYAHMSRADDSMCEHAYAHMGRADGSMCVHANAHMGRADGSMCVHDICMQSCRHICCCPAYPYACRHMLPFALPIWAYVSRVDRHADACLWVGWTAVTLLWRPASTDNTTT